MKRIIPVIVLLSILSIIFCSCTSVNIDEELIGTWKGATNPQGYVFTDNGKYEHYINGELRDKGSFSTSAGYNSKYITLKSSNGAEITYDYTFTLNVLFINGYMFMRIK